jgi:hypothetical protein
MPERGGGLSRPQPEGPANAVLGHVGHPHPEIGLGVDWTVFAKGRMDHPPMLDQLPLGDEIHPRQRHAVSLLRLVELPHDDQEEQADRRDEEGKDHRKSTAHDGQPSLRRGDRHGAEFRLLDLHVLRRLEPCAGCSASRSASSVWSREIRVSGEYQRDPRMRRYDHSPPSLPTSTRTSAGRRHESVDSTMRPTRPSRWMTLGPMTQRTLLPIALPLLHRRDVARAPPEEGGPQSSSRVEDTRGRVSAPSRSGLELSGAEGEPYGGRSPAESPNR